MDKDELQQGSDPEVFDHNDLDIFLLMHVIG